MENDGSSSRTTTKEASVKLPEHNLMLVPEPQQLKDIMDQDKCDIKIVPLEPLSNQEHNSSSGNHSSSRCSQSSQSHAHSSTSRTTKTEAAGGEKLQDLNLANSNLVTKANPQLLGGMGAVALAKLDPSISDKPLKTETCSDP